MTDFQITQLAVAFGTFTTIIVGLYRESRARKWDLQDRNLRMEEAKEEIRKTSLQMVVKVEEAAERVKAEVKQTHDAIAVNTKLTAETKVAAHQAFDTANDINAKIKTLHEDFVDLKTNGVKKVDPEEKP